MVTFLNPPEFSTPAPALLPEPDNVWPFKLTTILSAPTTRPLPGQFIKSRVSVVLRVNVAPQPTTTEVARATRVGDRHITTTVSSNAVIARRSVIAVQSPICSRNVGRYCGRGQAMSNRK